MSIDPRSWILLFDYLLYWLVAGLASAPLASAAVVQTTDPAVAAAFMQGATVESFDDLSSQTLTSYGAGQNVSSSAWFNSRDGATQPTYNSGGGSFNDPVGNPGTPIGIFDPEGAIASDVVSPEHVAGPLDINDPTTPFNNGFIEVFFLEPVSRVGFWVTHGTVQFIVRDVANEPFASGDDTVVATKGEFVGIDRSVADIRVAVMLPTGGADAFTIDDLSWSEETIEVDETERLVWSDTSSNPGEWPAAFDGPQAIAVSQDGRNVYAPGSLADSLVVFRRDENTGELTVLETFFDGVGGVSGLDYALDVALSADDSQLYVTSQGHLAVFARDLADGSLTFQQMFTQDAGGVSGLWAPFDVDPSPDGKHVYVADHNSQVMTIFDRDPATGMLQFLGTQSQGIADQGYLTDNFCISPDAEHVYVAGYFAGLVVYDRDPQTGSLTLVENQDLPSSNSDCVVSPDGRFVYTGGEGGPQPGDGNRVQILTRDAVTGEITPLTQSDPSGTLVGRLALTRTGRSLYVKGGDEFVRFHRDTASGALVLAQSFENGIDALEGLDGYANGQSIAVTTDERHVYTVGARDDAIVTFSLPRYERSGFVQEGDPGVVDALGEPTSVVASPDGRFAYVSAHSSNAVSMFEIDLATGSLIPLGRKREGETDPNNGLPIQGLVGVTALVSSPDGSHLYAVSRNDGALVWFDVELDGTLTFRQAYFEADLLGANDVAIVPDGSAVYAVSGDGRWIYFARTVDGSLSYLPLFGLDDPHQPTGIAVTPDGGYAMIADACDPAAGAGTCGRIEAYRRGAQEQLELVDSVLVGGSGLWPDSTPISGTNAVEISPDGQHVMVTASLHEEFSLVEVFGWDAASESLTPVDLHLQATPGSSTPSPYLGAGGLVSRADGELIALAASDSGEIAVYARSGATGELRLAQVSALTDDPVPFGGIGPRDVAFDPNGQFLLAVGEDANAGTLALFVPEAGFGIGLAGGLVALAGAARRRPRR